MAGLMLTLETSKGTLLNTQTLIQTSTHNISNASNTSYHRQKAIVTTNSPMLIRNGWLGTGATVSQIVQDKNEYIEKNLMASISGKSYHQTVYDHVNTAQSVFADSGENGISDALGAFWDSWDTLQQDTQSTSSQTGVYSATESLVKAISNTYTDLHEMATQSIPGEVSDDVSKINSLLTQIAQYNQAIMRNEPQGVNANDLRDARYQALQDLSELIPIEYSEVSYGAVTVTTTDGGTPVTLVQDQQAGSLQYDSTSNLIDYTQADGTSVAPASNSITGGSLGGLLTSITDVNSYIGELNDFAATLISRVNTLHSASSGPSVFTGTNATDIGMVANFLSGQTAANESPRALAISNLQDSTVTFLDGSTTKFSGFLSNIQKTIGTDGDNASTQVDYYTNLKTELQTQQQSISGVSLDEEMVELIKDQQIYQAAAKLISQVKQMMDAVINMV